MKFHSISFDFFPYNKYNKLQDDIKNLACIPYSLGASINVFTLQHMEKVKSSVLPEKSVIFVVLKLIFFLGIILNIVVHINFTHRTVNE